MRAGRVTRQATAGALRAVRHPVSTDQAGGELMKNPISQMMASPDVKPEVRAGVERGAVFQ